MRDEVHAISTMRRLNRERPTAVFSTESWPSFIHGSNHRKTRRRTRDVEGDRRTRKKIHEIEKGYAKPLQDEIKRLKRSSPKRGSRTEAELQNLENFVTAINITLAVENPAITRSSWDSPPRPPRISGDAAVLGVHEVGTYHNIVNTILQKSFIRRADPLVSYAIMLVIALVIDSPYSGFRPCAPSWPRWYRSSWSHAGIFGTFAFGASGSTRSVYRSRSCFRHWPSSRPSS